MLSDTTVDDGIGPQPDPDPAEVSFPAVGGGVDATPETAVVPPRADEDDHRAVHEAVRTPAPSTQNVRS